jgi:predicted TPR repeat methyltransferase
VREAIELHAAGRNDLAALACERALALDPRCADAYGALAWLLPRLGRAAEIPELFARWVGAMPDDPMAVHMHAATSGAALDRASPEYVAMLFDELAPSFDRTLEALGYDAPVAVADAIEGRVGICLDAGCGTGLVGARVRARVASLVGVDLSAAMIEQARARGIYDALDHAELGSHLAAHANEYDAIVAADVLVYTGALGPIAVAIAGALREGGVAVVTTECDAAVAGFALRPSGRFVHHPHAAAIAFADAGLVEIETRPIVLRRERGAAVPGTLTRARRPSPAPLAASRRGG